MEEIDDRSDLSSASTVRFPNLGIAASWAVLACVGFALLMLRFQGLLGLFGAALGVYGLQACLVSLLGVVVTRDNISTPRPLITGIPILTIGRTKIVVLTLREITSLRRFIGVERIMLTTPDRNIPALFASRRQRLAFFSIIEERNPDIRIYRQH